MTIDKMEKNLANCQKNHQTVRIQSQNALYTGTVASINGNDLSLKTKNGNQKFNMQDVDNYKIMK